MALSFSSIRSLFFGSGDSSSLSLSELRPKTSVIDPHQGVPRYAKQSNGSDIPTSGNLSLSHFNNPKFDQYAIAFKETRSSIAIVSGWRAPNTRAFGGWGGTGTVEGDWAVFRWNGYEVKISGYWSGGAKDEYGNIIRNASFQYFQVRISHAYTCYTILGRYDYTSLGFSNSNGITSTTNVYSSSVTIVCKNRA
ncbi:hypothetical protein N7I40_004020 [Vibrio parahaemolyticus]|nr:hypothetical protein [Vibrio parahaemolyticus]EHK6545763.1 hypothetical protein [Vibrio parahaemolyticus]EJV5946394.1 hypothetical protein [Vibrio parahaemolyticus]EKN4564895.1 hypothetical protein [Vibrio parahaemolyticus]ELJ1804410.1 hypothetical protein [Vibrio parahaemolyticus]